MLTKKQDHIAAIDILKTIFILIKLVRNTSSEDQGKLLVLKNALMPSCDCRDSLKIKIGHFFTIENIESEVL